MLHAFEHTSEDIPQDRKEQPDTDTVKGAAADAIDTDGTLEPQVKRKVILSEKGKAYAIEKSRNSFRSAYLVLTKSVSKLLGLLQGSDLHILKREQVVVEERFSAFSDAHQVLISKLEELIVIEETNVTFAKACESYNTVMNSVGEAIRHLESEELDSISTSTSTKSSSRTKYSSGSRRSNYSIKLVRSEAAAERAAMDVELNYTEAENKLKLEFAEQERKNRQLQAEVDAKKRQLQAEIDAKNQQLEAEIDAKNRQLQANMDAAKLKIETEMSQLSLQRQRAKADARERVLAQFDDDSAPVIERKKIDIVPTPVSIFPIDSPSLLVSPERSQVAVEVSPNIPSLPFCSNPSPIGPISFGGPVTSELNPQSIPFVSSQRQNNFPIPSVHGRTRPILPFEEPDVFKGDILHYPVWSSRFKDLIERNVNDPSRLLSYLNKYTAGEPNESIQGLLVNPTWDSYTEAKRILDTWYGDPSTITREYKKKLKNWPVISLRDGGKGIRSFSNFLNSCKQLMNSSFLQSLDDDDLNQALVLKLPRSLREKWSEIIAKCKESKTLKDISVFNLFCKHVEKEAYLATQPVFGTAVLDQIVAESKTIHPPYRRKDVRSARTFVSSSADQEEQRAAPKTESESSNEPSCLFCHNLHGLHKCPDFKVKDQKSKVAFIREQRICFGCLKQNHVSKFCRNRLKCEICSKFHPTVLHSNEKIKINSKPSAQDGRSENKQTVTESGSCMMTGVDCIKTTRIVPVLICHVDHPEREIKTYCALDEQSDCTFISDQLREKLGAESHKVNLRITTLNESNVVTSHKIKGLTIRGLSGPRIDLPPCYSRESLPVSTDQIVLKSMIEQFPKYHEILDECSEFDSNVDVGILIGTDCTKALSPIRVIADPKSSSYAIKSILGWSIVGLPTKGTVNNRHCNRIETRSLQETLSKSTLVPVNQAKELINPMMVLKCFEQDFSEINVGSGIMSASLADRPISVEDKKFLRICEDGIRLTGNGHYQLPLPFRGEPKINNNKALAIKRIQAVKKRMNQDSKYKQDYCEFMKKLISKGHAVKVPENDYGVVGRKWYLIHHGIYHPLKPNKIRVVYDGSAKFQGVSLNDLLLPGPCLTNSIVGVLLRFRKGLYCFVADIEQMFYSVLLQPEYQDFFRFLWWEDGDTCRDASEYRMTVHSFGVSSSPGCSIFALKKTAEDNVEEFGEKTAKVITSNSYVDDVLVSCESIQEAVSLAKSSKDMCSKGGFKLTKFAANDVEILKEIPIDERCSEVKNIDIGCDSMPILRTLGVEWCIESDCFMFRISVKERPFTRRGLLGTICSVFDPCGFLAPVLLEGKLLLQNMVKDKRDWDEPLPDAIRPRWEKWISELPLLSQLQVSRCFKPKTFGRVKVAELHHFSDASNIAYGQCSYLRLVDERGQIHCSFVLGKSRVAPLKLVTVPRLELTAALVSVRVGKMLQQELEYENVTETYWTDSSVVLGYISNESKRFHTYVANRVEEIRSKSQPKNWFHVNTKDNVADDTSRGLSAKEMSNQHRYLIGPSFLWKKMPQDAQNSSLFAELSEQDPEVRVTKMLSTKVDVESPDLLERICKYSSWQKVVRICAILRKFMLYLKIIAVGRKNNTTPNFDELEKTMSVDDMEKAKSNVIKLVQRNAFEREINDFSNRNQVKKSSAIYKLQPFLDSNGVLRVGGRLRLSSLPEELKHPVIMPKGHHITKLLIRHFHERSDHQGRGITLNSIRASGFWIVGSTRMISQCIWDCSTCRRLRGQVVEQKMSDLPVDRLLVDGTFSYCGMDIFGPWIIKQGRKELKRYGLLFTCLASRAIRIEIVPTLETDSFLNALRRFICRNGPVRQIRCDRGTNFVGASRELKEAYKSMNHDKIQHFLLGEKCDYFQFKFNAPLASYQGGVWERQIRSVRAVLSSLLIKNGTQLDEDSLHTLMVEAECVVNSRPLTVENLNNSDGLLPLSPSNILTMKTRLVLPPAGIFDKPDIYLKKRWRRVQHLANEFWQRWRKEYLQSLQERTKWNTIRRDLRVDDIVVMVDEHSPRNCWKLARIEKIYPEEDGHVRRVLCRVGDSRLDSKGRRSRDSQLLERPIQKLILLVKSEDPGL